MILVYFKEGSKNKNIVEQLLKKYGEEFKEVGDNHLEQTLVQVFSNQDEAVSNQKYEDFLFLDTMKPETIQQFARELNQKGVHIGRVAVRTENNVSWKLGDLMEEVDQEFRYFLLRDRLYELVSHPDKERLEKDPSYLKLMSSIYALIEDPKTPYEDLKRALVILTEKK